MVTEIERQYMWDEYAKDPRARINLGIRRRLAARGRRSPAHRADERPAHVAAGQPDPITAMRSAWATTSTWAIGTRAHADAVERRRECRLSTADPERLWLPLISNAVYGYQAVNVESQERNSTSLLNWTRRLIEVGVHQGLRPRVDRVSQAGQPSRAGVHADARTTCTWSATSPEPPRWSSSICPGSRHTHRDVRRQHLSANRTGAAAS